jgi:hypothetical protein
LWQLAALALLYFSTVWLIVHTAVTVARRDWLLVSLMILPLPVLGIWIITVSQSSGFLLNALRSLETRFSQWDSPMAFLFLLLGVSTILFIRVRQRSLKVGSIIAVGIVGGALAARSLWGDMGLFRLIAVSLGLLLFLTIPLLLQSVLGRDGEPKAPLPS